MTDQHSPSSGSGPSAFGARPPAPQPSAPTPSAPQPRAAPTVQASAPRVQASNAASSRQGSSQAEPSSPAVPSSQAVPRRILGIQPVLFVGIVLLALVTLVTVVLIFIGDFESQAPRVVWTVVVFLAFTGLLALDLVLARRSATPLVIGVAANIYLLAVLMIVIWMQEERWSFFFGSLFGTVLLTILVVRAAAAGAWGLIVLGERGRAEVARIVGMVAAALVGLVGILLTLPFAIEALGIDVGEGYWRITVAAIVVAALGASVTVLLFWNRRNIDWQEAEARGEHQRPVRTADDGRPAPRDGYPTGFPVTGSGPAGGSATGVPDQPAVGEPAAAWSHATSVGTPQHHYVQAQPHVPAQPHASAQPHIPVQPPFSTQPPHSTQPQPDASGLLPWPTYADGTPYPMGQDGQPVFPSRR